MLVSLHSVEVLSLQVVEVSLPEQPQSLQRGLLLEEGRQPALLFFDLSGMKFYNRENGYAEGDKLLVEIAAILVKHFSNENCGRFGQDRFSVFTVEDGLEDILQSIFAETAAANGGKTLLLRVGIYPMRMGVLNVSAA